MASKAELRRISKAEKAANSTPRDRHAPVDEDVWDMANPRADKDGIAAPLGSVVLNLRLVIDPDGIDALKLADWFEASDQDLMGYLDAYVAASGAAEPHNHPHLLRVTAEVVE